MKASQTRRNNGKTYDLGEMVPNTTNAEHIQRVEEWTMKSAAIPPSNSKKTPKQFEAEDHEAKSQLIIEAVRLLDTRERQLRYKPAEDVLVENDDSWSIFGSSNRFRESHQSAKAFVKDFEGKVNQKKAIDSMIMSSYPIARSNKNLVINKGLNELKTTLGIGNPVLEPESWRFKASRSVKFSIKQNDNLTATQKASEVVSDDRWALKQENDRDWWKWKLKQGFIQNDELLQKLVSQRQILEKRASLKPDGFKSKRNLGDRIASSPPVPSSRNSSRHIAVEIPVQRIRTLAHQPKTKEPIPNFYTPSKQLVQIMAATAASDQNHANKTAKQKMQTLKKDPYLAKLLAGNEAFKPEAMLTANIPSRRHDLAAQQMKSTGDGNVVKRKISLESLPESDDDDELTAAKFFNRDVSVLYEKLSDLDATATRNNMLQSREPSDGYLNLPILLATGRFSRFSKLPSMKFARNEPSSRGYKRSDRSSLVQTVPRASNPMNPRMTKTMTGVETKTNNSGPRIEDLPTKEWAKHVLSKFRKQGKQSEEVEMQEQENHENSQASRNEDDEPVEVVHSSQPQRKQNMKSVDEETNMLYHDILMSKWKKEKHETAVKNKANAKLKKYEYDHQNDPSKSYTKPRGLDIWLENIREKAKRDRLIAPYTTHDPRDSGYPVPELVTTFENAAFALQK